MTTTPTPSPSNEDRYLRNTSLISQEAINTAPVAVIGCGAIGSHLAPILAKLGVMRFILFDPQRVDEVNLSVQGFKESDLDAFKVDCVLDAVSAINSAASVTAIADVYAPTSIPEDSTLMVCVDSITARKQVLRDFQRSHWNLLIDGRMSAESLQVYTIPRTANAIHDYQKTFFRQEESYREGCTAKATVYCATMAAAVMASQFKRFSMGQDYIPRLNIDLMTMDIF